MVLFYKFGREKRIRGRADKKKEQLKPDSTAPSLWGQQDSNLRPSTRQADALPAELYPPVYSDRPFFFVMLILPAFFRPAHLTD